MSTPVRRDQFEISPKGITHTPTGAKYSPHPPSNAIRRPLVCSLRGLPNQRSTSMRIVAGALVRAAHYECVIKGNVNRKGERIFHLPGQLNYAQINMVKGLGERWFCTEAEAEAAGWRKSSR
jgi:hypothetical protein